MLPSLARALPQRPFPTLSSHCPRRTRGFYEGIKLRISAERVEKEKNSWLALQIGRRTVGATTYREVIREALRPAIDAPVPDAYRYLWRIRISGLLNLNLDRLATKAFASVFPNRTPIEFNGGQAAGLTHVLKSPQRYIVNLHGIAEDASTWVFTKTDLEGLLANEAYRTFIRSCLSTNTVVFLGISADDVAVGGHLETLSRLGVDTGAHYWVTDRNDLETDRWAEKVGVRVIRYSASDEVHSPLHFLFDDLLGFVPEDDTHTAPPVVITELPVSTKDLPSPRKLLREDTESIRRMLNVRAKEILSDGGPLGYEEYDRFCREYDEAIYRAWYTSAEPGWNRLLGYTLVKDVASGAFGRVYRSKAADGRDVAIKVLREDIRRDPGLLHAFDAGFARCTS